MPLISPCIGVASPPSQGALTVDKIVRRIHDNHERFSSKVARKKVSEQEYYDARYGFDQEEQTAK